jgi:transposase
MVYISSYKDQNWLIPQSIKDIIPDNHICFFVEEFVDSLDFSKFDMISEGPGHPSYHPRIIMKIIIQGMLCNERKSRKLASACRENFVFMYLAEKVQPYYRTIARFRENNLVFIKESFKETVNLAAKNDLIDLSLLCIDGTTLKANASKRKYVNENQLNFLDSIIEKMIEEDISLDKLDKEMEASEENLTKLDKKNLKNIVREYKKCKNKGALKEKALKAREELSKEKDLKSVSLSDSESRMMHTKEGTTSPSYNAQFGVDSKNQIILSNDVCQDRNDAHQFIPQMRNIKENITLKEDTKVAVDCAYGNGINLKFSEDEHLDMYVPNKAQAQKLDEREESLKLDEYEYDEEKNEVILRGIRLKQNSFFRRSRDGKGFFCFKSEDGKIVKQVPEFFKERLRMKKKIETNEGKSIYRKRKTIVEPVIGNIKENLGFRRFYLRGLEKVKIELNLISITHNLKKIWVMKGKIQLKSNNNICKIVFWVNMPNLIFNNDPAC